MRHGFPVRYYKKLRERNEALDCRVYNLAALEIPTQGFFGNAGRNTLILPGVATFDVGVTKNFALTEGADLQFKAEVFNLFNRANFGIPRMQVFGNSPRCRMCLEFS